MNANTDNTAQAAQINPATGKPSPYANIETAGLFRESGYFADKYRHIRPLAVLNDPVLYSCVGYNFDGTDAEHEALDLLEAEAQKALGLDVLCRLEVVRRQLESKRPVGQGAMSPECLSAALEHILDHYWAAQDAL